MDRRNFLRIAGGGVIAPAALLSIGGCVSSELPAEAVLAWQGPGAQHQDPRHWILSHAILAPHSHNLQSWLVDLKTPDEITLYCDLTRLLPETDPFSRQIMMSQGTFLEVLALAARQRGWRADIALFPRGAPGADKLDTRPTATIRLHQDASLRPDPLFDQVLRRRTNREAYEPRPPAAAALEAIAASVQPFPLRAGTTAIDQAQLQRHRAIAKEAWRIELLTPRTIMESYRLLRVGPGEISAHRDGISINSPMVRALAAVGLFDRSRPPGAGDASIASQLKEFDRKLDATLSFFWLVSEGNDRSTQVNAGRAYVRAQLAATAQGLSMHPLSQALQEYPEQAKPYAGIHRLLDAPPPRFTVQMWARLGYAPPVGPAPRRGLAAHLLPAAA